MGDAEVPLHPDVAEEYAEAYAWYAERSDAVAGRFEAEVERALALIREDPGRWPSYDVRTGSCCCVGFRTS